MYSKILRIMLQYQVEDVRYQFYCLNSKFVLQISILCNTNIKSILLIPSLFSITSFLTMNFLYGKIFKMELIFSCQFLLQNTKSSMIILS